jgi:large subunit ribosomal protein L4
MKLNLLNAKLKSSDNTVDVADGFIDAVYNESLIHQIVTSELTNARSGTKKQKTRTEVSGGGSKPWKQKGTGRARAGSIRSPLWRTGGKTFAARPKTYDLKINKKMYAGAIRSIISELNRAGRLIIVENFDIKHPKTKDVVELLGNYLSEKVTLITHSFDMNLFLASRNLKNVYMIDVEFLDSVTLVGSDRVIITVDALKSLEESLT